MKREVAAEIVDSLKEAGVDFVASLTEANLHDLVIALGEDPAIHHVPVTREEEGIGICAGAYLGGKKPAMVMMNAGFLLSANALATVCIHPGIPALMLIGHSGGVGEDASFDLGIIERFGCSVFAFDPTPRAIAFAEPIAARLRQPSVAFY